MNDSERIATWNGSGEGPVIDRRQEDTGAENSAGTKEDAGAKYNAAWLIEHAPGVIAGLTDDGKTAALIYADCYATHSYNDLKGYQAGDQMLRKVGQLFRSHFMDGIAAYYSEDRFVAITGKDKDQIIDEIGRINAEILDWSVGFASGLRVGVYLCDPSENILTAIDRARRAKIYYDLDHSSRVHFYDDRVRNFVNNRDYLLNNLDRAIREDWLQVVYQPVIDGISFRVSGFEALCRWVDPERGTLLPEEFIHDLEAADVIHIIDLCVLDKACRDLRGMMDAGEEAIRISVNIAIQTLEQPGIHGKIMDIIHKYGLKSSQVSFDMSENGQEGILAFMRDHIGRFRKDGITVFFDHFGEGKTSWAALEELDFSYVKLDVRNMDWKNPMTKKLLSSFVSTTRSIGRRPVAFGVETKEQMRRLHELGFGMIEGHCVTHALPADEICRAVRQAGFEFETEEDRVFFQPLSSIDLQGGEDAFPMAEQSGDGQPAETQSGDGQPAETQFGDGQPAETQFGGRQIWEAAGRTVCVISYQDGVIRTLYQNEQLRKAEEEHGRTSYEASDGYLGRLSPHTEPNLQEIFEQSGRIGDQRICHVMAGGGRTVLRIRLVSSCKGRKAFLIAGRTEDYSMVSSPASPTREGKDQLEEFLSRISDSIYYAGQVPDPSKSIELFLERIGRTFAADRAYIFEKDAAGTFSNTYEWCSEGVSRQKDKLQNVSRAEMSDWMDVFAKGEGIMISDMEEYQQVNLDASRILAAQGISRLIVWPIFVRNHLAGYIGLDNPARPYMQSSMPLFRLLSGFAAMQLQHKGSIGTYKERKQIDEITGLYSFSAFHKSLSRFLSSLRKGEVRGSWALVHFNISQFKVYNDRYGFAAGNTLLKDMAMTIVKEIKCSYATRTDGDTFYALVREENVETVIRSVHDAMFGDPRHCVSIYAGIYTLDKEEEEGRYALDRAKIAGRMAAQDHTHYVRRFTDDMNDAIRKNEYLISHVDEAARNGWIKVFYQPIVDTLTGKVSSAEALSRWIDPTYGFLNPAEFIGILEDARLLYKVDLYVLETVCRDIAKARGSGKEYGQTSINLSRHDLELDDLHERIDEIINRYEVPHDAVHFEITESALIENEQIVQDHIERFHRDGYQVWLDDFGSGYSSLNTLQHFDFDCLKIDMMFLRHQNQRTPVIMRSIVDMAKQLGMLTLTEGVETEEEYQFLRSIGCTLAQGYLFSKPDQLDHLLKNENLLKRGMETARERIFYRQAGKANVLSNQPASENDRDTGRLCLIFEREGDLHRVLYISPALSKILTEETDTDVARLQELTDGTDFLLGPQIHRLVDTVNMTDRPAGYNYVAGPFTGRLVLSRIADIFGRQAYLLSVLSVSTFGISEKVRQSTLQDLYSLYESIEELVPSKDQFRHIFGLTDPGFGKEELPLREAARYLADHYIHPDDRQRFLEFLKPENMEERVDSTPDSILNGFFHMLRADGTYAWRRIILARTGPGQTPRRLLMCIARNQAGWSEDFLNLLRKRGLLPADIEAGHMNHVMDKEGLFDSLASSSSVGIFWKDRERRFVGVNQAFLRYYGMTEAELVGKTDDDMGWHPEKEGKLFRDDEERVLKEGTFIHGAVGKCLVDGEERTILANKAPIREKGEIIGLVGYFLDVTDIAIQLSEEERQGSRDLVTGLPGKTGMTECFRGFALQHNVDGQTFGVIMVQLLGMGSFRERFGSSQRSHLFREIGMAIHKVIPEEGIVGTLMPGRYVILTTAQDEDQLARAEAQIITALKGFRRTKEGVPVTLYFMTGASMHEKGRTMEETFSYADANLRRIT